MNREANRGTLEFTYTLDAGHPGTDPREDNVISRALHVLIREGRPQRAIAFLYYNGVQGESASLRWFGAFVLTAADRILFFPGNELNGRLYAERNGNEMTNRPFRINHITLEPDRESWHLTGPRQRDDHQGGPRTFDAGNDRHIWCGLSLRSEEILPQTYRETEVAAPVPNSDAERRVREAMAAMKAAPDRIMTLHPETKAERPTGFPHFIFITGPEGFELPDNLGFPFPRRQGWVDPPLPTEFARLPARETRIPLPTAEELLVLATWLPGQLQLPLAFTAQELDPDLQDE